MTLSELKALAEMANRDIGLAWDNERAIAAGELKSYLSPERVLAMLAVIEAAKAMRKTLPDPRVRTHPVFSFDAALAALESDK